MVNPTLMLVNMTLVRTFQLSRGEGGGEQLLLWGLLGPLNSGGRGNGP